MERLNDLKNYLATHKKLSWIIGAGLLVLILLLVVVLPMFSRGRNQVQLDFGTVTVGSITENVESYGTLDAQPSQGLIWNSDGVVSNYTIRVGDVVQKGDVLMELEPSSQDTDILNAYTDLLDAQDTLEQLEKADKNYIDALDNVAYEEKMLINRHADKLAWNYGQSSEERVDAVWKNYYTARSEVWVLQDAYDAVKSLDENDPARVAAYDALQQGILTRDSYLRALNQILGIPFDIAVETDFIEYDQQVAAVAEARVAYNRYVDNSQEISAAQAAVQVLENKINEAKIIAPFNGTVTAIDVMPGELVESDTVALRLDNMDNLIVRIKVGQDDVNKVQIGQEAVVTFDAIAKKAYTGFVQTISSSGEANSNGVVQYAVDVKLEDADEDVKPGFTAVVSIAVAQTDESLLVPNQALTIDENGFDAIAMPGNDGMMQFIPVEVGAQNDVYTAISAEGIAEGDRVVLFNAATTSNLFGGIGGGNMGGGPPFGGAMRNLR
ncbi:MAG: HlyD family secretion protein [Chloroflexota bacterium]|nr:HlyD family secretion protein [Chloroflexota bacterium]